MSTFGRRADMKLNEKKKPVTDDVIYFAHNDDDVIPIVSVRGRNYTSKKSDFFVHQSPCSRPKSRIRVSVLRPYYKAIYYNSYIVLLS